MAVERSVPVLVVADYQTTVCIVTNLLKQIGYASVDVAGSASAALGRMRGKSYGLIIVDWSLELAHGGALLAELRADDAFDETPVLMLAPQSQAARVIAAMAEGSDRYLFKPFNASTLQNKIDAALATRYAPAENEFTTLVDA